MKHLRNIVWGALVTTLLTYCVEPVNLEKIGRVDLLVVEGMITDQPVIQEIRLSRTVPLTAETSFSPESNATVWILDDSNVRIDFIETEDGIYRTSTEFSARLGVTYQLHIERENGDEYVSETSSMLETSPIDSLYAEFTPIDDPFDPFEGHFNFYIDSRSNPKKNKYFRWTWNSTYQLRVPNPSRWLWTGGNTFIIRELGSSNNDLQVEQCWRSSKSTSLFLQELLPGETQVIRKRLSGFATKDSPIMRVKYSIEAKQYAISPESYAFWSLIEESSSGGFLFDTQVGTIQGNVRNVNKREEIVLGFFEVVEEQSVREFFEAREFFNDGYRIADQNIVDCSNVETIVTNIDQIGEFMEENGDKYTLCYFITAPPGAAFCLKECAECTLYGDNQRPDFW